MGNYFTVFVVRNDGEVKRIGNYRCRGCAKNHMIKNRPSFVKNRKGRLAFYNKEYKNLAKKKGWKLDGQEVKR